MKGWKDQQHLQKNSYRLQTYTSTSTLYGEDWWINNISFKGRILLLTRNADNHNLFFFFGGGWERREQKNFGEAKNKLWGSCLPYYAYRKMIAAIMVLVRLFFLGNAKHKWQIWGKLPQVPDMPMCLLLTPNKIKIKK